MWARGLKPHPRGAHCGLRQSRPMWARGLKLDVISGKVRRMKSRPMWARGLKLPADEIAQPHGVAPHVGAWIETYRPSVSDLAAGRRAPCGRVD